MTDSRQRRRRPLLQALEPRIMFDGAVAATVAGAIADAAHDTSHPTAFAGKTVDTPPPVADKQVVFIENDVTHYQRLVAQLPAGDQVVILDSRSDGLAQIAQWARTHTGYKAIHIISHGEANDLMLGTLSLNKDNLASRKAELATIGQSLQPGGDILLYGCNIASGTRGEAFIQSLAQDTQANVAASSDATGASRLGGDWVLERSTGQIDVAALTLDYDGLLTRPIDGKTDFNSLSNGTTLAGGPMSNGVLTATAVSGWDISLSSTMSDSFMINVSQATGQTSLIECASLSGMRLSYIKLKPTDGSLFTLTSVDLAVTGIENALSSSTLQLIGYRNGQAVTGAIKAQAVIDAFIGGQLVTFDVSNNSLFQGIDSFLVQTDGNTQIVGSFCVDNVVASDFHFPGPVISTSVGNSTYSAGTGNPVAIDSGITLSNPVSNTELSATITISGGFYSGEDILTFSNNGSTMGNITGSYDSSTGVLVLLSSGGTATNAQWQAALASVTYQNSSLNPTFATRTISMVINDGSHFSAAVTKGISIAPNVTPAIYNLHGDHASYVAGGNAVHLDSGTAATVGDIDSPNFGGGSVSVHISAGGHTGEDVLGIDTSGTVALSNGTTAGSTVSVGGVAIGTIASNGDGVNGHDLIVTLNSNATLSRISTLLTALNYSNSAVSPNTATRTIQVAVNDGHGLSSAPNNIMLTVVNQPILTPSGGSAAFTAGDNTASTPVVVDSGLTVIDPGSPTLASATVSITGNFHSGEDVLAFSNNGSTMGNITGSYNSSTGVLTLTSSGATATLAQWQAALRSVTYTDSAVTPNTATRTLSFIASDGSGNNSSTVTRNITITATDQTPIATTSGGSASFTAGDNTASTPVVVDSGLTVSDLDNSTLASATVSISGGFHAGEDLLAFSNNGSTMGNITANYNSSTGVLTLTSSGATATLAQWQAALRSITYRDSAITPNTATRTISFSVNDGSKSSSAVTRNITVTATDQTPVATTSGGSAAFTAGDNTASTPVVVDSGLTVSDQDNSTLASATVAITGGFHSGEDVLAFSNNGSTMGNITGSYNSGTGVLTLSSSGATATLAQWQAALRSITYTDSALTPNTATRTVSFTLNDGSKTSSAVTRNITVAATDQTPIASTSGGSASFTAGDNTASTPVVVDSGLTVSDLDNSTLASATVSISGGFHSGEDLLAFSNNGSTMGNITASYNSSTGVLTLTSSGATATLAQWQAALRSITYANSAVTPNTAARTISFSVNDGSKTSSAVTRTVTVTATDQTPVASTSGGSATFTAGDNTASTPVVVDSGLTVSDLDNSTLASATVAITGGFHSGEDVLAFSNNGSTMGNITGSYNSGTGVLTLTSSGATATLAQWQAALRSITYRDSAVTPNTATRTVSFTLNDGSKASSAVTRSITVAATDQTPIATTSGGSVNFNLSGPATPVTVDTAITITDLDSSTLASATVAITGNFHAGEDVLAFSNNGSMGNITASYNSGTGALTLTSSGATATLAQWQAALRAVTYLNSAATPDTTTRTIGFTVSDGSKTSTTSSRNVTLLAVNLAPQATASGSNGTFAISASPTPVVVDSGISVSDLDNSTLTRATVSISGGFHSGEDILAFSNNGSTMGNITGSYNSSTGVLTLNSNGATATLAQWQAALRAVTYLYTPGTPDAATRTISFVVNDGTVDSNVASRSVAMTLPAPTTDRLSVSTDTGVSASDGITGNATPTVTGTALANASVTVYVDGVAVGSTTADANGVWRHTLSSALSDGRHVLSARVSSGASQSEASAGYTIIVDTAAPRVQSITPQGTVPTDTGRVSYDVIFSEPVNGLSPDAIRIIASGSAKGSVSSVVALSPTHYVVQLTGVSGSGSLAIALGSGAASDLAGNANGAAFVSTAATITEAAPPAPPAATSSTPVTTAPSPIVATPITPDIVLAAIKPGPAIPSPLMAAANTWLPSTLMPIVTSSTPVFGQDPFTSNGTDRLPATTFRDNNAGTPLFISRQSNPSGPALQVMPDLGAQPLLPGQPFSFSLPPDTVVTRQANATVSLRVTQSNGQPLPSWLRFDPLTGRFSGTPPAGWDKPLLIDVTVQDSVGHRGVTRLKLQVGTRSADAGHKTVVAAKPGLNEQLRQQGHGKLAARMAHWLD